MGRTPCCEKMGLKKGPWTPEEDQILMSYIHKHGHPNWRALPKLAGLLRCGKSCRLRWINYLRPDIKRGNFTEEEEDTIVQLHQMLGNRWSAIAARLPGRTDNEIKNIWHTHLKKRLLEHHQPSKPPRINRKPQLDTLITCPAQSEETPSLQTSPNLPTSPQRSSSDLSSLTEASASASASASALASASASASALASSNMKSIKDEQRETTMQSFPAELEERFWGKEDNHIDKVPILSSQESLVSPVCDFDGSISNGNGDDCGMEFWYNIFIGAGGGSPELPEF